MPSSVRRHISNRFALLWHLNQHLARHLCGTRELLRYNQVVNIGVEHVCADRMADARGPMDGRDVRHDALFSVGQEMAG